MTKPKSKESHHNCCKHVKPPKTPTALAELFYPSAEPKGKSISNRLKNPEHALWNFFTKAEELDWWFAINTTTPLLDGSGDGKSRGTIVGHAAAGAKKGHFAVCINAASIKRLPLKPRGKAETCAFTFSIGLLSGKPPNPDPKTPKEKEALKAQLKAYQPASGWFPLSGLVLKKKKSHAEIVSHLKNFQCCADNYATWAIAMSKPGPTFKFCAASQVHANLVAIAHGKASVDLVELPGSTAIQKALAAALPYENATPAEQKKILHPKTFYSAIYINKNKGTGRFGDYLARTPDKKCEGGYTYIGANLSAPRANGTHGGAPIALDVFPAGWKFTQRVFKKGNGYVLSPIYGANSKLIGHARWVYGSSVKLNGKPSERSYGWVPSFALTK